ncbi:MAG TPA: caspase family protein [Xanthobacteraceae bacterium]
MSAGAMTLAADAITRAAAGVARFLLLLGLVLGLAAIWTTGACNAAERRVALVVGAASYLHATALAHTLDDARDIAAALKRLGFEVDLVLNPNRADLEAAVRRLGEKSRGADAALFYYAGHAIQSQGVNWVLPISADIQNDRVLRFEALDLDAVREQVEGLARVSLLFIDACREDPFKQRLGGARQVTRSGLAAVNANVSGTYIAFATSPGTVAADGNGAHSPFTAALLHYIETPGLELAQMMAKVRADVEEATDDRQIPWDQSSLKGDYYFNPAGTDKALETTVRAINGPNPQIDLDALFWESVDRSKPADLNAYLGKFPGGMFAELARNRLAELKAVPVTPSVPPNPKLLEALAIVQHSTSQKVREDFAAAYQAAKDHKAITGYLSSGQAIRVAERQSASEAEESGLEACEVLAGAPCLLVALDDSVPFTSDSQPRTMPRVHYVGTFNPERVPSVQRSVRQRPDVVGYVAASSPKAAAYSPFGRLFIATGAQSLRDAEQQVLALCNEDAARLSQGSPCVLYASNNDTVLSRRSRTPITPATVVAQPETAKPVPVQPPDAATFHDAFVALIERALPALAATARDNTVKNFEQAAIHKAIAVHSKDSGYFRLMGWPAADAVEEATLEGCQSYYGEPCALLAVDQAVRVGADGALVARDMPRVRYQGSYDTRQIPAISAAVRGRADLQGYPSASGPKAIAFHPWGQVYVAYSATGQNEAEANALSLCNGEPTRKGQGGPCYLYASGSEVVFPRRLRLPKTPAPASAQNLNPPVATPVTAADGTVLDSLLDRLAAKSRPPTSMAEAAQQKIAHEASAKAYLAFQAAPGHRAIAAGLNAAAGASTITTAYGEATAEAAQAVALERCQVLVVDPCSLIAFDRNVVAAASQLPVRDMSKLHYEGSFDVAMIPGLAGSDRNRSDVVAYERAPSPKAAAIDNAGKFFAVSAAKSQAEAEGGALAKCGNAGCYLYAVGNRVVLPKRWHERRPLGNSLADVLSYAMISSAAKLAGDFGGWKTHKAIVLFPELPTIWSGNNYSSGEAAERASLEACGLRFNTTCTTLVVDDKLVAKDPSSAPRPSMPRLTYQGPYRPEMVPLFDTLPQVARDYARMRGPKAMAIRPAGPKITAESGATLAEAEAKALAKCTDPDSPYPCFIYAANDTVILPSRRTEPGP